MIDVDASIGLIVVQRNGHTDMLSTLRATGHKQMRTKQANRSQRSVTPKQKSFTRPQRRMARYPHRPTSILAISMKRTTVTHLLHLTKTPQSQSKLPLPNGRRLPRIRQRRSHHRRNRHRQRHLSQQSQSRPHNHLRRRRLRRRRRPQRKRRQKAPLM